MNNTSTYIDFDNVSNITSFWNQTNSNFISNAPNTNNTSSNGFDLIKEAGFDTHSFDQYNQNVNELTNNLLDCFSATRDYVDGMENADDYLGQNIPQINVIESKSTSLNTNIIIDDKINDIHDSNMSDLKEVAERVNNKKSVSTSQYSDGYQAISAANMNNINNNNNQEVVNLNDSGLNVDKKDLFSMQKDNVDLSQKSFDYTALNTGSVSLKDITNNQRNYVQQTAEYNADSSISGTSILGSIKPNENVKSVDGKSN